MKILIVSEMSIPYAMGGGEVRYRLLTRELVRRGHEVTWLSMRQCESPDEERIDGVRYLHRGPRIESPPTRSLIAMLRFMGTAFLHILTHRYDCIDAQTYAPLPAVWFASFLSRQKMVSTIHATIHRASGGTGRPPRTQRLNRVAEAIIYRIPYAKIITVSDSTANALISHGVNRKKIRVIPNGIELLDSPRPAAHRRDIDLVFAGRIVPEKNIEDLIEVVRICHDAGAVRRVVLIGEGPLMSAMIERTRSAGLSTVIEFVGRKSNAEVLELLQQAKVFFHASRHEGFPLVMVEAMACGLPVVAYRVPGVIDVVDSGTTGLLVAEGDTRAHARACLHLLGSNEERTRMAAAGRLKVVESLTLSTMVDRMVAVYREMQLSAM